ncbi:MAG: cytochrome c oxidase subunit II [Chloroflexi bacterium]|nr:cytochrome c oxidase subunit II [Chloroflexota bacterium]
MATSRLRTVLRIGAPLLLIGLLAGCLLPPEPKTEVGRDVFNLYVVVLILAAIVFVAVEGFIIYAVFRYRRKPGDDTLPEQLHGNTTVEIIWTMIPAVIVFILFAVSMVTLGDVEARSEEPGVIVNVEGFQWNWTFSYENGPTVNAQGGEPPVLAVPVGEPVRVVLSSIDVNHAFYVPQFLIKRDLINLGENGRTNELEFTITEEGTYAGQCAEFCGTDHADMKFVVDAMPRAEYDEYIAALASGETPPPTGEGDCTTTIEIKANNTQFDIGEFEVPADTEFCIAFENQESVPHNVSIYDGGEALFTGSFLNEPGEIVYNVPALPAGDYRFICDAHPQAMVGDVTATE